MREMGITDERFWDLCAGVVRERKLKKRITAANVKSYYRKHKADLKLIQYFLVEVPGEAGRKDAAALADKAGLMAAVQSLARRRNRRGWQGTLTSQRARDLPPWLSGAAVDSVLGPVTVDGRSWMAEILRHQEAKLNRATRAHIENLLFQEWLEDKRREAEIQWHWM
jgi:hypothetical protein